VLKKFKARPLRHLKVNKDSALKKYLKKNLSKGIMGPFSESIAFLMLFVKKKDQSFRVCVDFIQLNKMVKKK
jgi:hypothetical protein